MRSLLFVPGDSPRKLEKALGSGADVLLLDLEDSVALSAKEGARKTVADFLTAHLGDADRPLLYVRVNALDTGLTDADLDAVMASTPDGIMLPKAISGRDVSHLDAKLAVREATFGTEDGATRIVVVATETAASLFHMGTYRQCSQRLAGLTWGAEDLSADIGAAANRDGTGAYLEPFRLARSLALFAAVAAEVPPIDTVFTAFRDTEGLEAECRAAARDGFTGKMAIHPAQVPVINAVFTPSDEDIAAAKRIAAAFAGAGDVGVVGIDGEMVDRPHLRRAEKLLERARLAGKI
ncbi:citrate lyase subunit beta/citryl-CoA lyase [Rhodobium orientis]|uniref:CoA ester lyase n=1 Tax=Rhodobium orientis TaxID=34017 RepID=A0A327JRS6_9HYPH|nr:CoA ester lyase [Rhodobium orientis]MBB4301683.1 citrate lyase subunit beta/citryl-CoA lyase [Rhodobium orientis]MBK5952377.1 CoA ester lyase [Rhodobium orientis]RAI28134.1 CoA ester lyase [Rhodobium orientis]